VRHGAALLWLALSACPSKPVPGSEVIGSFGLHAEPMARQCQLDEVSGTGFDFEATFSVNPDASVAYATLSGYTRDAGWDGQVLLSTASAPRVFQACSGCVTTVVETLEVAIFSGSQAAAVGGACPESPLDGGTPRPDQDAGVLAPLPTRDGFDSVLACGELRTSLQASEADAGGCSDACHACTTTFRLSGLRR
jgi:hypothetical protein